VCDNYVLGTNYLGTESTSELVDSTVNLIKS